MGWDIHIAAEYFQDGEWHLSDIEVPSDRNYWAFAVLADVCNGYGFAGTDRGDPVIPIDQPRDLPDDLSAELADALDAQGEGSMYLGYDCFSYLTLRELLDYDLNAEIIMRGYVSKEAAERYRQTGELPLSFAGWTSLPNHEKLEWKEPVHQAAWLVPQIIETLQPLCVKEGLPPEHVRIVFGFDY
jgi:hypothetical protein